MKLARREAKQLEKKSDDDISLPVAMPIANNFVAQRSNLIEGDVITVGYGAQVIEVNETITLFNRLLEGKVEAEFEDNNQVAHSFKNLPLDNNSSGLSNSLAVIIFVLLLHLLAILLLNEFWTGAVLMTKEVSPVKIHSYLYQPPQTVSELETGADAAATREVTSRTNLDMPPELQAKPLKEVEAEREGAIKPLAKLEPSEKSKPLAKLEPSEKYKSLSELNLQAPSNVSTLPRVSTEERKHPRTSVSQFTQSYLEKQKASQLDALIIDKAEQYTQKRSLSEMDADMQELIFPEVEKYSKVITTDHRLDPNRIVRHGDTCYRIVKVPTQLNPYAENIGYPFNCGGDKIKKAINDAISARLEKRMLPIKK
ncbi:hypothetical protein [Shewanella sp. MBTL60-007]|uniref:hypothetical protein n=1 Tax=Shewanella sp. MBTL60-007 TaxID=2815911 RepID=UPI001BBA443F|nr:hypothetical protein [Shewanella sp. MBTL60-007]GIU18536.1 hypothetical protein TUM3792_14770 [Shewanella sp. MBTL60-007]